MEVQYQKENKQLRIMITEDLDHHTVEKLRRKADYEIERHIPKKVIFDFSKVTFMDSAGIGLLLGRYKNTTIFGGQLEIENVNEQVEKILNLSGITKLIPIHKEECA